MLSTEILFIAFSLEMNAEVHTLKKILKRHTKQSMGSRTIRLCLNPSLIISSLCDDGQIS